MADTLFFVWLILMAMGTANGQFVTYTLSYTSTDCSGTAGVFQGLATTSCTPGTCLSVAGSSHQQFCHAGTLESLGNPLVCPSCAYCGWVGYQPALHICQGNSTGSAFKRLGVCVATPPLFTIFYGCAFNGVAGNYTEYTDAACTIVHPNGAPPFGPSTCIAGQPQCFTTSAEEGYCSYTNLFTGGGGGTNNTHGNGASPLAVALGALLFGLVLIM